MTRSVITGGIRGPRAVVTCALVAVAAATTSTGATLGASSSTVVTATVPSATTIDTAACATGAMGVTDLGVVLPASNSVSTGDCTIAFGSSNDTSMLRAFQQDGTGVAMRALDAAALDTTFSIDGVETTPIGTSTDVAYDVALDGAGRIVLVGTTHVSGGNWDFAVTRYDSNGALDPTFSADGIQATEMYSGAGKEMAHAVAIDANDKIVVAGRITPFYTDFAVLRYNPDGTLDTTFSGDGMLSHGIGSREDSIDDVALDSSGRIVVVGSTFTTSTNSRFAVARYNADGTFDNTFSGDGRQTLDLGSGYDFARALAIDSSGRIVVVGSRDNAGNGELVVVRYNADGTLDTSFSGDGIQTTDIGTGNDSAAGVVLDASGRIVVGGYSHDGVSFDYAVARYNPDGTLDTTFSGDGLVTTAVSTGSDLGNDVMLDGTGRILVVGYGSNGSNSDIAVVRYHANGTIDTAYSGDGISVTPVGSGSDQASGGVLDDSGKLVVAGESHNGTNDDIMVARFGLEEPVDDYVPAVSDWASGANTFGACLRGVGAGTTADWTVDADASCTAADTDPWNAIPSVSGAAGRIATAASGVGTASINLRFGFRSGATQAPGIYEAPITFEVVAPAA